MRRSGIFANRAGFSIHKSSGIGRIFQDLQDGGYGGLFPDRIAKAVTTRQTKIVRVQELQDLVGRSDLQKRGEDECKTVLDLTNEVFVDFADRIPRQANRQRQSEYTSLCFVEQSCRHTCSDGMQFQLG